MHGGEQPLYAVNAHWVAHLGGYLGLGFAVLLGIAAMWFNALIGLLIIVIAGFGLAMLELVRRADRLALYSDGIAREFKLLSTKRTFAEYESVQDLEVNQSFFERLVGVGTVHVNTSGSHGQEIIFRGIVDPHRLEAAIRSKMKSVSVDTPAA